ncbi:ferritin family protein [Thermococcus sp.]
MKAKELIERLIWQENELYNLYKLGETFALFERPELRDTFMIIAEEELRHRETLIGLLEEGTLQSQIVDYMEGLSLEPILSDERTKPESLEELVVEGVLREKHAHEMYLKLAGLLREPLSDIFIHLAREELTHAYRLKLIYESL